MKKLFWILGGMLVISGLFTGCRQKEGAGKENTVEQSITKLVWESDQDLGKHEKYFNQVLKEKNYPYEVEFVIKDGTEKEQVVDLKAITWSWEDTYDITEEIQKGHFLELDHYLNTEEGTTIRMSLPQNVWDTYKVDGKQYTVLSVGFVPSKIVYIWDVEMAEKYDIHPEKWNEKIWEYEEELMKVYEGEKGTDSFVTVDGLRLYSQYLKGMTQVLGLAYPLVIREADEIPRAELLYETPEYQEYLNGVTKLYEKGIYHPAKEENFEIENRAFLTIVTDFKTKDAYAAWKSENFWNTHEMKEVWSEPLWRLSCCAQEVGITTESAHPEEAFSFLCSLYKDKDLTNALMWGKKGTDYEVKGNTAEKPATGGYIPSFYVGNNFIAYAEVGQDEKKKEIYPKWLKECEKSRISGFNFSGKSCEEELQNLYHVVSEWEQKSGSAVLEENQALIQQCKEAGADCVIAEWNRQYQEWRKQW